LYIGSHRNQPLEPIQIKHLTWLHSTREFITYDTSLFATNINDKGKKVFLTFTPRLIDIKLFTTVINKCS
jgi:hypothetical protein